jgi:hypothetical protein
MDSREQTVGAFFSSFGNFHRSNLLDQKQELRAGSTALYV